MYENLIKNYLVTRKSPYFYPLAAGVFALFYAMIHISLFSLLRPYPLLLETADIIAGLVVFLLYGFLIYGIVVSYRRIREKIEARQLNYERYVRNSPDAVFITDGLGRINYANQAAERTTGQPLDRLIGSHVQNLWSTESSSAGYDAMTSLVENGRSNATLKFKDVSGKTLFMSVSSVAVSESEFMHLCRDVTRSVELQNSADSLNLDLSRKMENELETARKREYMLESTKKYADMGHMLTAISHHWRQPLNSIGLYIQEICDSYRKDQLNPADVAEFEKITRGLIREMSDTIDDFRMFFSPVAPVRAIHVLKEIIDILRIISAQITYLGIDLSIKCGCEKSSFSCKNVFTCPDCEYKNIYVYGDVGKFRHSILNLIYNSIDSVAHRSGERGHIVVFVHSETDRISVDIDDNGSGFSQEILRNPFTPYRSDKREGTGIGLFMANVTFTEHFKGSMKIGNTDTGAHVGITLPRYTDANY